MKYTVFYNKFMTSYTGTTVGLTLFVSAELRAGETIKQMVTRLGIEDDELLWIFEGHPKQQGEIADESNSQNT